ncbi:hypothetical protein HYH03_003583 [Edaphochlamys debaryana]|uniref:Uncharacterized protein n=1 Tax=Edaphochlamys debaryana TaxID=47281 RepID=A0A835YBQ1_9CHLO|nr:hypothetical protein HYH03_003583 [Edaphochlamys debaryana]|eukprot:KAG2498323.1 hypothetical protein HYH03_003583 [Edaphochlamys debaryana]
MSLELAEATGSGEEDWSVAFSGAAHLRLLDSSVSDMLLSPDMPLVSCLACPGTATTPDPAAAASGGHVKLMDWLLRATAAMAAVVAGAEQSLAGPAGAAAAAAAGAVGFSVCLGALEGCDLATVQRLSTPHGGARAWARRSRYAEGTADEGLARALCSPTPDWAAKAEWLFAQGIDLLRASSRLGDLSARVADAVPEPHLYMVRGKAGGVRWLLGAGVGTGAAREFRAAVRSAAEAGHLEVLRALRRAGRELRPKEVVKGAAAGGRLAVLQWAAESLDGFAACLEADAAKVKAESQRSALHSRRPSKPASGAYMLPVLGACGLGFGSYGTFNSRRPERCHFAAAVKAGAPLWVLEWLLAEGCKAGSWAAVKAEAAHWRDSPDQAEVLAWAEQRWRQYRPRRYGHA